MFPHGNTGHEGAGGNCRVKTEGNHSPSAGQGGPAPLLHTDTQGSEEARLLQLHSSK